MQSPHPPRPPYPSRPGATPGESDRDLVARLRDPDGGHHAIALLLARHWRAAHDYAAVCLASPGSSAAMVATAAFHRVLRRLVGGAVGGALRPQLLVAVRETVRAWAADEAACVVLPELSRPAGGRGLRAVRSVTPERRQLAERAFHDLPGASQCLLWHTEVEAEPINIPAGLLAVDTDTAAAALQQAREQFRAGCVRAHRELAPTRECRFYNRLLDVPMSRGAGLLPDVQLHLRECRYCRDAAEQLGHFDGGLEVLLAETVLGWGARRYLDSRPPRAAARETSSARDPVRTTGGGRHRTALPVRGEPLLRHRKALALGVALTSLALLATVFVVRGWTDDASDPGHHATWGAPSSASVRPGTPGGAPSGTASTASAASAVRPAEVARGRLRSLTAGLCLGVHGGRVAAGATAELAACSAAASQQWSYQEDGLLRSAADPAFCLDSDPARRTVLVSDCVVHAGEVTYDLTVRGELLLRRGGELVVAPGSGASRATVVVEARDGSEAQRWLLDPGPAEAGEPGPAQRAPGVTEPGRPERHTPPRDTPPRDTPPSRDTGAPGREPAAPSQPEYQVRLAPAGCCGDAGPDGTRSRDSGPQVAVSAALRLPGAGAEAVAVPVHAVDSAVSHVVGAVPEPVSVLGR